MSDAVTPKEKRGRVVDHAKRLYSIVVGLAVAEACKRLFPFDSWNSTTFVLFCTFLVTIVGLRSLIGHKILRRTAWRNSES